MRRWILTMLAFGLMMTLTAGGALAVGLVEMDMREADEFWIRYADFVPVYDVPTGTGPEDGESWSVGTLLLTRGTETFYIANCDEWVSLREEASKSSDRIRKVYYGEDVELIGTWHEWGLVWDYDYDRFGWIPCQYLSSVRPAGGVNPASGSTTVCMGLDGRTLARQDSGILLLDYGASSYLADSGVSYGVSCLFDGNPDSAWVEGVNGYGVGEEVWAMWTAGGCPYEAQGVAIRNGYQKSEDIYLKNSRPSVVSLTVCGQTYSAHLMDAYNGWQCVLFPEPIVFDCEVDVTLTIDSVYSGSKYADTCMTEMDLLVSNLYDGNDYNYDYDYYYDYDYDYESDEGCDYDLFTDSEYWYNSAELMDRLGQPISPAAVAMGLSYAGQTSLGGDDAVADCYTNNQGLFFIGSDDSSGILEIQLVQYLNGYTVAGMQVGMSREDAKNAVYQYFDEEAGAFAYHLISVWEDNIYVDFVLPDGACGGLLASYSGNVIGGIYLYLL